MPWPTPNVLGQPFDAKFGKWGGPQDWLYGPGQLPNNAAWYDLGDTASTGSNFIRIDSSNRVSLIADKSGNSAVNCLCLPGSSGNTASAPKLNAYTATNMDVRIWVRKASWFTDGQDFVNTRPAGTGGWTFGITGSGVQGRWYFLFYQATSAVQATVDAGSVPAFAAFTGQWCRVTRNGTTGDVSFYYAAGVPGVMPSSWTLIQTKNVATGAMDASTATYLSIGARQDLANGFLAGNIGHVQIRDNVLDDGTGIVFNANFSAQAKLATSFTESSANAATVTINATGDLGAHIAGERDLYQATAAKQPIYLQYGGTKYAYFHGVAGFTVSVPLTNDTYDVSIGYLDGTTDTSTVVVGSGTATFGGTDAKFSGKKVRTITVLKSSVQQAKFDADYYVSGTTFTSSDTKTWTLNGGATIVDRTCIYFDGSDDYMKAPAFSLSNPTSVYLTGRQVSWTANDTFFSGNSASQLNAGQVGTSPAIVLFQGSVAASNTDWALKTAAVVAFVFNGATSLLRVNRGTATTGNPGTGNANGFVLGWSNVSTEYANITASEILIRSAADATATQDRIIQYGGRKWNVAV